MSGINIRGILKGTIFSAVLTFIVMMILTAVSYFMSVDAAVMNIIILAGLGVGVFTGALPVARSAENMSAVHGMLVGIGAFLIILICSLSVNGKIIFNTHLLTLLCVSLFSGMLGGITGR